MITRPGYFLYCLASCIGDKMGRVIRGSAYVSLCQVQITEVSLVLGAVTYISGVARPAQVRVEIGDTFPIHRVPGQWCSRISSRSMNLGHEMMENVEQDGPIRTPVSTLLLHYSRTYSVIEVDDEKRTDESYKMEWRWLYWQYSIGNHDLGYAGRGVVHDYTIRQLRYCTLDMRWMTAS